MLLQFLRRKATTGAVVEVCAPEEFLQLGQETLTLEEKVTRYFEQWRDPVHRYIVAVFGHPAEAEEITQETFLRLYRALRDGQSINNTHAWVFRAAHNLAINRVKSQQFVELLDDDRWEELRRTLREAGPNPEQRLLQQERFDRLRAQIARLTIQERQCLHLRTKGLRYREIAEVVGLGTTTVAETLYRVIDKLTKENNG
jgi:RNA polymerase sigma-70 factor (ECF subfamily)